MQDTDRLTLGMWVDFIIDYNNMEYKAQRKAEKDTDPDGVPVKKRRATQADFDRF